MIIKELQILSEALWESVKTDPKFFSSIQLFVKGLAEFNYAQMTKEETKDIVLYANKIDGLFRKYRSESSGLGYIPFQIDRNDESVKTINELVNQLNTMPNEQLEKEVESFKQKQKSKAISSDKSRVFIVHGHDDSLKNEVARFIEKLDLEPIILHEQASSGNTIIEKIEEHSNVGFGIVLYTPCDVGSKSETSPNLQLRARQNVVFEHGFLIGKIGRRNVCALVKGDIEKPNDISGVVYIPTEGEWKLSLAKEMNLPAASGRGIMMDYLFYFSPQEAGNSTQRD